MYTLISHVLCLSFVAMCVAGCELISAPGAISCDKLRRLTIGMTKSDVAHILGRPKEQFPSVPYNELKPPTDPVTWDYSNDSLIDGGVRLFVEFRHDRVVGVSSYIRTILRDFKDDGPRPTLFRLNPDGVRTEGKEFKSVYCP